MVALFNFLKLGIIGLTRLGGGGPSSDALLLETGDYLLLETGDFLLLE